MKNEKELRAAILKLKTRGDSTELNAIRTAIFDAFDLKMITQAMKDKLFKDLYDIATDRGIFFMRVTERIKPEVQPEEDEDEYEDDESYEESYSYEDEEEEEDE